VGAEMSFKTEQEEFWAGGFGDQYIERNQGVDLLASNLNLWVNMLKTTTKVNSCIEFGTNIGMNLKALKMLYPHQEQFGIEINVEAAKELEKIIPLSNIYQSSIFEFEPQKRFDLCFIKGVLIHTNPKSLEIVYKKLVESCGRYLLVAEYYNPSPITIPYRGYSDRLFKRDFAGEILDLYPEMSLVDYGFAYRNDPKFPQDDITWFLMERAS
jgi:pseudaminic acid biosynthesis-associated methylase